MFKIIRKNLKDLIWLLLLIAVGYVLLRFVILPSSVGTGREMPEQMKELAEKENVEWMAGMWVELPDCVRREEDIAVNIDSYLYTSDLIVCGKQSVLVRKLRGIWGCKKNCGI